MPINELYMTQWQKMRSNHEYDYFDKVLRACDTRRPVTRSYSSSNLEGN